MLTHYFTDCNIW